MLSSLTSNGNSAESSDLTGKILSALGPAIAEHWPKIEPYADKALAAAQHDETIEMLARNIYP